jgi:DNA polymerase II small subunit/DNA polymerase delta subunit B
MTTESLIERYTKSADYEKSVIAISAAYLLFSIGNEYMETFNDTLRKYNLWRQDWKYFGNNVTKAFDLFINSIKTCVNDPQYKKNFVSDYEELSKIIDEYIHTKHVEPKENNEMKGEE